MHKIKWKNEFNKLFILKEKAIKNTQDDITNQHDKHKYKKAHASLQEFDL